MVILYYLMAIITGGLFVFSYRQGIKDSFNLKNNIPVTVKKEDKDEKEEMISEYNKILNYEFDMAGDEYDKE